MRIAMFAALAIIVPATVTSQIAKAATPAETSASCSIGRDQERQDQDRQDQGTQDQDGHDTARLQFRWNRGDSKGECEGGRHCSSGSSEMLWSKWSGITPADLQQEGAHVDARMKAESGEMRCVGTIHAGALEGEYSFTPDEQFRQRMEVMGFNDLTTETMQGYAMLDVTTGWVRGMRDAGVKGLTAQKLMGLRALRVDLPYVQGMAAAGYPELQADKLTGMKAVGVSPEKVEAVRKMGYMPTEEELIQLSVFKIDAPFVERMKSRGFKNITIAQLVQIKVFKLDE
jgi:hypothetical protein